MSAAFPRRLISALFACLFLAVTAAPSRALEPAGRVTRVQGLAVAVDPAAGASRALAPDAALHAGDRLETGREARLEARFRDGTVLTLSADTVLVIDTYVFDGHGGGALLDLASGAFRAVTGAIADVSDPWFQVKTPLAAIGIRGTDFWGGWLGADGFNVFMISGDKRVVVSNAAGEVMLAPGQGTSVAAPGASPAAPKQWGKAKVARAVRTVTFD